MSDDDVKKQLKRMTRRGFVVGATAAAAGIATWKWTLSASRDGGAPWPFRRMLQFNEKLSRLYYRASRLTPELTPADLTKLRVNGHQGLAPNYDVGAWRLRIEGAKSPVELTIDDIKALPKREMITELKCIEGWSMVTKWTGVRLADLVAKHPPNGPMQYVAMETPGRGYYVGLDMESAIHPQTLLVWAMNDIPLDWHHGSPLRLAIPLKYGIKNIKRIGLIRYTNVRPPDFWGERGYDWYSGF
ncbi:MAG TPA: molybdopterin-dependent oxidoreductase [Thermoanaerobaculia bacterium]